MAAFDQGTLFKYNSLTDRHLVNYFSNEKMRHHLVKNGLITKTGEVVPDAVYRVKMARREHRRRVRDLIAQAIVHKALEMERSRQIDIRKKIEEIAKIELVRRVREDRSRMGDEDCISYFSPGNMDVSSKHGLDKKRSQSDIDEYKLPATPDERSRMRLRKILPNEEIESKHLSQLDSLTLGEYSRILQKQDRERINKLPYLGIGKTTKICKKMKKKKPKKKKTKSGDNSLSDDHVQVDTNYIPTKAFEGTFPNRDYSESLETVKRCTVCNEEMKFDVCQHCSLSKDISINELADDKNSNNTNNNYNNQTKKRKKLTRRKRKHKFLMTKTGRSNQSKVQSMTKLSILFHAPTQNRDYDIMVEQQPSGGNTLILYRDTLANNSIFNVVSHRHMGFPFSLTFYINSVKDSRISTCCEYKHKVGKRIGGPNGHFSLFSVEGANPCYRCLTEQDLANERKGGQKKDSRSSEAEVNQPESISVANSSERFNHEENQYLSNYSSDSESESENDSLNESERKENNAEESKKRKESGNKDESDDSVEISVNDSESKSERNRRESNLDNCNNNALDVHRKDSNEKEFQESASMENEFSVPLTNANTKVTIKPKVKNPSVDSTVHVVNHKEENGDSVIAQDPSMKVDITSETENEKLIDDKENIQGQDQNYFHQSQLDNSRSLTSSSENSDETNNGKPIQLENEMIVSPNNDEPFDIEAKEKITIASKSDVDFKPTEPLVSNGSEHQNFNVGINLENKFSNSSNNNNVRDSDENKLENADTNLLVIKENEENNIPKPEKVEPLHLMFSSPTNTSDFHKENSVDIKETLTNSEDNTDKELKVTVENNNLDNLIVKEDSNVSKDSEINQDISQIHKMLKKPTINSDSEDESSSESATSSDSDGELGNKFVKPVSVNAPENGNGTELKLNLPKDDNETGKPSSSSRIDENSTDEDSETESNNNGKSNSLIKIPDGEKNVLRSSMSSESETDYDEKSSISMATENDNPIPSVESSAPIETKANEVNSEKGLDVSAENDDINFKRAKEICQSFKGCRINSLKIRNSELPSYVFDSIAEQLGTHSELKSIELSGCEVEIGLLNLLAKYLHNWPNLETLILSDNEFSDYSLQNLIDMLKFLYDNDGNPNSFKQCLKLLDFTRCSIKENDLTQLIEMIGRNTRIEKFVLDGSKKIRPIFPEICKALQMSTNIKLLSVKNCDISEEMMNEEIEKYGKTIKEKILI